MDYDNKDLPLEYLSEASDPYRTNMVLKFGNIVACSVIVIGASMIAYVLFPGLFN